MNTLVVTLIVLAVVAVAGLLAAAVPRLKRASRWVDATLQDHHRQHAQHPTTTDPKENEAA